ncbi:MAG: hypothetical protein KBD78_12000 [Oligoflexales bacterium]|nr:hypothetical protein [Oligoflexales bacterium]
MNISIENFLNNFLHVEYSKTISKYFLTMCLPFLILISCKTKETVTTQRKNPSPEKIISWQNENNKNLEKTKKSKILRKDGEINLLENAEVYTKSYDFEEAAPYLWQMVENEPKDVNSRLLLIDNLLKRSLVRDALSIWNQTTIEDANSIHLQTKELYYALILKGLREFELAEEKLIELIDRFPEFEEPYHYLFDIFMERVDFKAAFKLINRAIERCGRRDETLKRLAQYYLKNEDHNSAKRVIDEILEANPDAATGLILLAGLQVSSEQIDAANMNIDLVLKKYPLIVEALLVKAEVLEKLGQKEAAEINILKALKQRPLDGQIRLVLAEFYTNTKRNRLDAKRLFDEVKVLSHPYSVAHKKADAWLNKLSNEYL